MELFVPSNDVVTYFGGGLIVILPVEDADAVDTTGLGPPVLWYAQLSRTRACLASTLSEHPSHRLNTPPSVHPILGFASDAGQRTIKSLCRWLGKRDPDRDYTPLDLRVPNRPLNRRLALLESINLRHTTEHAHLADALSQTRGELAKLRQDVEGLQDDLFDCTQELAATAFPFRVRTVFPANRIAGTLAPTIAPFASVRQPLPCKARGLAGIDLLFTEPAVGVQGTLFFELTSREEGAILRSWELDYADVEGWVHLPCKEVLKSFHVYLDLTVRWSRTDPGAPTLNLADASELPDAFCRLDDVPVPNRALTFRIWSGPPGQFGKAQAGANWAMVRAPEDCLHLSLPCDRIAAAEPLSEKDQRIECISHTDRGEIQIQPQAGHVAAARISNIALKNVEEICASIRIAHDRSPNVEFAMAAIARHSRIDNAELAAGKQPKEVLAFSGWQLLAPNMGLGMIELPVKELDATHVDLVLATRTHSNVSGACAWARWSDLRFVWRPTTARTPTVGTATGQTNKSLELLWERRERFAEFVRGRAEPLATLVCCIHRPDDIKNMAIQLSHQLYLNKEIIVVVNNEDISERQVAAAFPAPEDVRIIRCRSAAALGVCLNAAVQKSNGDYVLKIDADDLYFPNYARDMVAAAVEQSAKVVGKRTIFVYAEEENRLFLKYPYANDQHAFQTAGGTLCVDRSVFEQVVFRTDLETGTDLGFHTDCEQHGIAVFSTDPFNYVYMRHRDNGRHTWREEAAKILGPDPIVIGGRGEIWRAVA